MLLSDQLVRDEGNKLKPYLDTAVPPKITIGVGRNLTDNGITANESLFLLANDITKATTDLLKFLPWVAAIDQPRRNAIINMSFNLGISRLMGFPTMLTCLKNGDWNGAASAALNSVWAKQVGDRAVRIADTFRTGVSQ